MREGVKVKETSEEVEKRGKVFKLVQQVHQAGPSSHLAAIDRLLNTNLSVQYGCIQTSLL